MPFRLTSAKLTGSPDDTSWSQVHDFEPDDIDKRAKRGRLFACVSIKLNLEGISSATLGRELITRLQEEYYGDLDGDAFSALRKALDKIYLEFSSSGVDVGISSLVFLDNVIYLAKVGTAKVIIFRHTSLVPILTGASDRTELVSGHPQANDIYLLGTDDFFASFPEGIIKAAVSKNDPVETVEQFAPSVHERSGRGNLGLVVVKFSEISEPRVEEIAINDKAQSTPNVSVESEVGIKKKTPSLSVGKIFSKLGGPFSKGKVAVGPTTSLADRQEFVKRRKMSVSVGIILLALLVVSIVFGVRQKQVKDKQASFESQLSEAQHNLDEAKNLISLDPERARQLFSQSKDIYTQLRTSNGQDESVSNLGRQIDQYQESILGEYRQPLNLFIDLSLLTNNFEGDEMVYSDGTIYVLDKTGKKIVSVDLASKRSEVVAGPTQISTDDNLAAYVGRVFVQNDKGAFEVGSQMKKVLEPNWTGDSVLPYVYAGNFYILDKSSSKIYRYAGIPSGFASGQEWLSDGVSADLSNVKSWAIDGTVWILNSDGKLLRFSQGNQISFKITGVYPELNQPNAIYTGQDLKYLYLLDPQQSRIVVVNKDDGTYKAQYVDGGLQDAKSLVASESEKKIIILKGQKLFSIDMGGLN